MPFELGTSVTTLIHWRTGAVALTLTVLGAAVVPACSSKDNGAATPDANTTQMTGNDASAVGPGNEAGVVDEAAVALDDGSVVGPDVTQPECHSDPNNWPMFGQNICNTASTPAGAGMSKSKAKSLTMKWIYSAQGDVSATPAVVDGFVYVPDWSGYINKLDAKTGNVIWSKYITTLVSGANGTTLTGFNSRTTPLVTSDSVIFGTGRDGGSLIGNRGPSAFLLALNKDTGTVKWITPVHDGHPAAVVAASPVYDGKLLYFGVSSSEEAFPHYLKSGYQCCSFRGSVFAVEAATGKVVWQTHTISDALYYAEGGALSGYAGLAVWSSSPVIDLKRNLLYLTLGNNYVTPAGAPGFQPGDTPDAIVALDLANKGAVKWAKSLPEGGRDVWTYANLDRDASDSEGLDSDFGCGANLFTVKINGQMRDLVGAGQKSGIYFALDAETGNVVWQKQVGPGSHLAGIHWGTATDGRRIYVGVNNEKGVPVVLGGNGKHKGETVTTGTWAALDPATGEIIWQIANPAMTMPFGGASVNGPVTVVNGVVFGGSMDKKGTMFALDADTGDVLWSFESGGTVYGGAAIANGWVYWGSGYPNRIGFGTLSKQFYAFGPQ